MDEPNEIPLCHIDSSEEPELVKYNQEKLVHFRRFGFFLVHWKKVKYEASNRLLLFFYLVSYFVAIAIGSLAFAIKEIFKDKKNFVDKVDDLVEASFIGIFLGIAPSFWNYMLREYSTHLPQILTSIKKLEITEVYKKLVFTKGKKHKISYSEGYRDVDHNDDDDESYDETQISVKKQWWIVKYGPLVGMILSVSTCIILIIISFFWDLTVTLTNTLIERSTDSLNHLKQDLPTFIMCVLFPIPCYASIWFCIFFLEWQRNIYASLRHHIRTIKKSNYDANSPNAEVTLTEESKKEFEDIWHMLNKLQKVFILLNKKIFPTTLVLDFTLFIIMGVFCCCKIIQNHSNFVYIFPLSLILAHLYFICKWSNDLMEQFNEIIEVLNEMHEGDVQELRREFNECPPQVKAFGGFNADYGMMTAVIAFMLSIISISGMIWPEVFFNQGNQEYQHCYEYQDNIGGWNHTLCVKQYCYNFHDEYGRWNQTLCIKDKLNGKLFLNGTLSLRNIN